MHAYFTPNNYTLYFNKNTGNDPSPASKTVIFDAAYGALATITKKGHSFNGWFTAASGGTQVTDSTTVKTASDHTVYAQWTPNTYYVTISITNGTAGSSQVAIVYPGSNTVTIKPNNGVRNPNAPGYYLSSISCNNGYTATGYTTGRSATGQQTITINNNNNDKNATCTVTYTSLNYNASPYCEYGRTLDGSGNCTYYYQNNEGKCGCLTVKSCRHESFNCEQYYEKAEAPCTVKEYEKCHTGTTCVAWNNKQTESFPNAVVDSVYCNLKHNCSCDHNKENIPQGSPGYYVCEYYTCSAYNTYAGTDCPVKSYNSCRDSSFGCEIRELRADYDKCGGCQTADSCNKTENEYRKYSCPNGGQLNGTTCEF